jgi:hypothetical protein
VAASPPRPNFSGRSLVPQKISTAAVGENLLVFMPKQFQLLFAFVFGDLFTPFLFQVTHCQTSCSMFLLYSIVLKYHSFEKIQVKNCFFH